MYAFGLGWRERLTGLCGPSLYGLSVDPKADFGAGRQGEHIEGVWLQALNSVEAHGVEADVELQKNKRSLREAHSDDNRKEELNDTSTART